MNLHQTSPAPPRPTETSATAETACAPAEPLPLVAPAIAELESSELIRIRLAGAIDPLASLPNADPSATNKTCDVLDVSINDLPRLTQGFERLQAEEQAKLELSLEEQTRGIPQDTRTRLWAQDKPEDQESDFRASFEEEKARVGVTDPERHSQ